MKMVLVKTAELSGAALDWAVAKVEGCDPVIAMECCGSGVQSGYESPPECCGHPETALYLGRQGKWSPSTDWAQGGPLIARYNIDLNHMGTKGDSIEACLNDFDLMRGWVIEGETHLVAACRAIVAAKLGDTVSVPAELATP